MSVAAHPWAQDRVADELKEAGLLHESSAPARQLQHADLSQLPFLDAVRPISSNSLSQSSINCQMLALPIKLEAVCCAQN